MVVRAIDAYILDHPDGYRTVVKKGEPRDSSDPLVRAHSWAFRSDSDVEDATARPGERRGGVRRK